MRASCFSIAEIDWSHRVDSVFRLHPHRAPSHPLPDFRIAAKVRTVSTFRVPLGEVIPKSTIAAMLQIAERAQLAHVGLEREGPY